jgi:N-acetylglutamate synthase-like GNAT family acetyltransferase
MLISVKSTRIVRKGTYQEAINVDVKATPPNYDWLQWFVCLVNKNVIARSSIHVNGKNAWLNHAIVSPSYRMQGIYTEMIEARLLYAQEQNVSKVLVYCNFNSTPTILKMGFQEMGFYFKKSDSNPLLYLEKEL